MTEYWKSQARKYCEFCKCWLADNNVSVSFHENGKRHKESVQRHISKLSKKSAKEFKQKEKMDDDIKKMEKAAMAAYLKDVENNYDITSQTINNMLNEGSSTSIVTTVATPKDPPVWQEVKGDDGISYFWNTETNDTTWDTPDDYISVAKQEEQKMKEKEIEKAKINLNKQRQEEAVLEFKAHLAREKMKERAVKKEETETGYHFGPLTRAPNPYGSWKPVVKVPEKTVDFQLPKVVTVPPPVVMEPETIKFKEKKVDSLGEGLVDFKKRKLNTNFKRNMRQKTDDE